MSQERPIFNWPKSLKEYDTEFGSFSIIYGVRPKFRIVLLLYLKWVILHQSLLEDDPPPGTGR